MEYVCFCKSEASMASMLEESNKEVGVKKEWMSFSTRERMGEEFKGF